MFLGSTAHTITVYELTLYPAKQTNAKIDSKVQMQSISPITRRPIVPNNNKNH